MEDLADIIDNFYETHNVYRCLLVCMDTTELQELSAILNRRQHSVYTLDDRCGLLQYSSSIFYRMLAITYTDLLHNKADLEKHVLPEHNLIIIGSLETLECNQVQDWLQDARRRGFGLEHPPVHLLKLFP